MATPRGSETLAPAEPSPGQASMTISQTDMSAARYRALKEQKLKLLKNDKLAGSQPQADYNQSSNNLSFKYSARRSVDCVSMSSSKTTRQTSRATQVYTRNTVSHLHYLERKIKLINSKADSFRPELESAYSQLCCKIDTYTDNLNRGVATLRSKSIRGDELERRFKLLNAKRDSYTADLKRKIDQLNAKKVSYYGDLLRPIRLLRSKLHPFDEQFSMHIQLLETKLILYVGEIDERTAQLSTRYGSYINVFAKELRNVDIYRCNCGVLVRSTPARIITSGDNV